MRKARLTLVFLVVAGAASLALASGIDLPETIPDEPFDLQASRLEYTNGTMIASGGVTGRFENVMLSADMVSGNPDTGDLHMEGDIHFERDNVVWQGTELNYNYITQTGDFGPSAFEFDPVLMSVDHVERVSTNEYLLKGATFTTCPEEKTHYHLRAREAYLVDERYIKAKGVTVYLGKVPVFYLPYWRQDLEKSIFSYRVGYGSEWGAFALIRATVPVNKNIDSLTDVNLYAKRGVGLGQGFAWDYPNSVGEFSAFHLYDQDPYTKFDSEEARDQIDRDRYRLKLEELYNFTDTAYLNTKWNYLSDPAVLEEFFKSEYRKNPQPENYASLVYGNSYVGTEAFVSTRLNDYYDNLNRVEYSADLYRTKLGNSPFYFQSENSVAYLDRVYGETNNVDSAYNSSRVDSYNVLSMPQTFGFLSVVPRATYRATYYSDSTAYNGGSEEVRQIPGVGMEVSFQANKVLSDRERWYGKGLRHKMEPYVDYIYAQSTTSTNRLLQFDDVDTLDDENKLKIGLRNVLQTKRDGKLSRFIDLDVFTYYLIDKNGAEDTFSPLFLNARMPLTKRTMVDLEGAYDWNKNEFPYFNTRASHESDDITYSLEHLYQQGERSLWTSRIELFPEADTSFEAYCRYDHHENDIEEVAAIAYKNFCCLRYGLGAHFYDDNEFQVMFSIGLSAYPGIGIGSGL
ncbi:LPS-assembly protein LptD [Pontiella sulfatireligans]|uniref:LPS-assembly protein LptD n=1 Tax=Pontiella sulfatireligans TaxID=2750658 RepID=A0A6C2UT57_9BACT|nr:LPS-assembly protein LptD [Pontiella sulfatireligans]VGO23329.1 LPS-assembly protein LptD [Pontiella sulfatireligans]